MSNVTFGNIDHLKRNLAIEGETGTELGLEGGMTLIVLAATEANPRWKKRGEDVRAELNRLSNARADGKRVRDYLAGIYAECIVVGWRDVVDEDGEPVTFNRDNCKAFLLAADDAYAAVDRIIYETKHFRGQRIEAIVEAAGN